MMKKVPFSIIAILICYGTLVASQVQTRDVLAAAPQQQEKTANSSTGTESNIAVRATDDAGVKTVRPITVTTQPVEARNPEVSRSDSAVAKPPAATSVYRVGIGDVLDIQLLNSPARESTLFSVLAGGLLDYPLAGEPFRIQGLTTTEISTILASRIRLYESPQVAVTVREYASHNVIVTGLVRDPGTKALRREAVPLFVVLAEAQPRPDAARAIIMRAGNAPQTIDIADTAATGILVFPNDVIRIVPALPPAPMFFYIAGQVAMPGQKAFHPGMTLTQSIFASGGVTQSAGNKVKVMRQRPDGRLLTTEYDLKKIEKGKDPDPAIEAGDRIEIARSRW